MKEALLTAITIAAMTVPADAGCMVDVSRFVGWQVTYSGTVTGYIDEDGTIQNDFEGCEYGRTLIVDHAYGIECADYGYAYAYWPDIVLMSNGFRTKACIDGRMYDVRQ